MAQGKAQTKERGYHEEQDITRSRAESREGEISQINSKWQTVRHELPKTMHCQCHCKLHSIVQHSDDKEVALHFKSFRIQDFPLIFHSVEGVLETQFKSEG